MPVPGFQVRRASRADASDLAQLAACTFRDTYFLMSDPVEVEDYIRTNFTPQLLEEQIADDSASFMLGSIAHRFIGCGSGAHRKKRSRVDFQTANGGRSTVLRHC